MLYFIADIKSLQVSFAAREGSILRQYKGIGNNRPKSTIYIWMGRADTDSQNSLDHGVHPSDANVTLYKKST